MIRLALVALASALALTSIPAVAQTSGATTSQNEPVDGWEQDDANSTETDSNVSEDGQGSVGATTPVGGSEPHLQFDDSGNVVSNLTTIEVPVFSTMEDPEDPDGVLPCEDTRWLSVPPEDAAEIKRQYEQRFFVIVRKFLQEPLPLPECPDEPDEVIDGDDMIDVVRDEVLFQLPRPDVRPQPEGRVVTGRQTYLRTNRPLTFHSADDPRVGHLQLGNATFTVQLWATGSYTVDWGQADDPAPDDDPANYQQVSGPHTVPGADWDPDDPFGSDKVWHVYTSVPESGQVTITVTDTWTIHYRILAPNGGGEIAAGTMTAELNPVSTDLQVHQLQAVVTDG